MPHRILPAVELAVRRFGAALVASALLHGAAVESLTWAAHRSPPAGKTPTTVVLTSIVTTPRPVPTQAPTRRAPVRERARAPGPKALEPAPAPGSLVLEAVEVRPRELQVHAVKAEPLRADVVGPSATAAGALVFMPFAGGPDEGLRGDELLPPRFDPDEMSPPEYESGPPPEYTPMALERRVEGLVISRCIVSTAGAVSRCQVVKGLPFMEEAVVRALEASRYRPARKHGKPVTVRYDFRVKLVLPK